MKAVLFPLLSIFLAPSAMAQSQGQDLAIAHATVYASPDAPARKDVTVLIRHGVISGVGEHLRVPSGVETIACNGCVVIAGFWNAHVHFMEPKWNDPAHQPAEKLTRQMSAMLTHSGFTTVVDTGSDAENTIALRRRVESGEVAGPRIFTAGIPLFPAHALPYYLANLPADFKAKMAQPETATEAAALLIRTAPLGRISSSFLQARSFSRTTLFPCAWILRMRL
jgi:imidazolonepropionase-like amidohydrolase